MKKPFPLLFLLLPIVLFSQTNESNIWYFGSHAGIDFNSGTAVPLTDGALSTYEGCASLCDTSGQLLFYTDGTDVWDRFHTIMPNGTGLRGNSSSSQSAIIVPRPGIDNHYYIFTVDDWQHNLQGGFRYSLVNMALNGGRGDLFVPQKNTLLRQPVCEKVTAVKHQNEQAVWVITHDFGSDAFLAYLVTDSGVASTPVISHVGTPITSPQTNSRGYLKASPDGKRLAMAVNGSGATGLNFVELYNFDNATGNISRPLKFENFSTSSAYGVEFSFNSSVLYVSERFTGGRLMQYNLLAGGQQDIENSRIVLGTSDNTGGYGGIQLAPDGKLYVTRNNKKHLDVIHDPDRVGLACKYIKSDFYLDGKISWEGLPPFIQSFFLPDFTFTGGCINDTAFFTLNVSNVDSVFWDFGDPTSGVENFSRELNPIHIYRHAGVYSVTMVAYRDGLVGFKTHSTNVKVVTVELGPDTVLCMGNSVLLDPNLELANYLWSDNSTDSILSIDQSGEYWVEIEYNGCKDRDTIEAIFNPIPVIDLGPDTLLCEGDTLFINATFPNNTASYEWSDSTIDPIQVASSPGIYEVSVTLDGCIYQDQIALDFNPLPQVDLGNDTTLCEGQSLYLSVDQPNATYLWQDNTTDADYTAIAPGVYSVDLTVNNCTSTSSIQVDFDTPPFVDLGADLVLCEGQQVLLNAEVAGATYQWQDYSNQAYYEVSYAGTYEVTVTKGVCSVHEIINIDYNPLPIVNLGNDTTLCEGQSLYLSVDQPNATYLWQDNTTDADYQITDSGTYNVEVFLNNCTNQDEITVYFNPLPLVDFGADTTLCEGDSLLLDATNTNATYTWQDNSTQSSYTVFAPGIYTVAILQDNCLTTEAIQIDYNPIPLVDLGNDTTLCEGQSLYLSVDQPNATYLWQDNTTDADYTAIAPGVYSVDLTVNNCTSTSSIQVDFDTPPFVDLGADLVLCEGQQVLLNAEVAGATYQWQDYSNQAYYEVSYAGTYEVTVTKGVCSVHEIINIDYTLLPIVNLGNDTTLCDGEVLNLNLSIPGATYLWQDNFGGAQYTIGQAGLYSVEVTLNGCSASDEIEVNYFPLPIVDFGKDTSLCEGDSLWLYAENPGASYLWQDGSTAATYLVKQGGIYSVDIWSNGCKTTKEIEILYKPIPLVQLGNDTTLCEGESLFLSVLQPGATYIWQDNSTNGEYTVVQPGIYAVEVNLNDCKNQDFIEVAYNPLPLVALTIMDTLCEGQNSLLDAGQDGASYLWQDQSTDSTFLVNSAGQYQVEITIDGCSAIQRYDIQYQALPLVDLGNDTTICEARAYVLDVKQTDDNATYLWQDNSNQSSYTVLEVGTYQVTVALGDCLQYDEINIATMTSPTVDLGEDVSLCEGEKVLLDATYPDARYLWQDGSTESEFWVEREGWYEVKVSNKCGEENDDFYAVYSSPPEALFIGHDTLVCPGTPVLIDATNRNTDRYKWQDGSSNPRIAAYEEGTYTIEWENECGSSFASFNLAHDNCHCDIYIPNAISVDDNGINDQFKAYPGCELTQYHLQIFNRWGAILYETQDIEAAWDGYFRDKKVQTGIYVWVIHYKHKYDEGILKGDLMVIY